jgi:hypothetical protein
VRRVRLGWGALALVMFALPVAFGLARTPEFSASTALYPRAVGPYQPPRAGYYLRALREDTILHRYVRLGVGAPSSVYRDATFGVRPPRALLVTVKGGSPDDAHRWSAGLALALQSATLRQVQAQATADARWLEAKLSAGALAGATRRDLARRIAAVKRVAAAPTPRITAGAPPPLPRPARAADKLVDALPGDFPPRPSPLWAGLAGLLVVALARAFVALVRHPERVRSGRL